MATIVSDTGNSGNTMAGAALGAGAVAGAAGAYRLGQRRAAAQPAPAAAPAPQGAPSNQNQNGSNRQQNPNRNQRRTPQGGGAPAAVPSANGAAPSSAPAQAPAPAAAPAAAPAGNPQANPAAAPSQQAGSRFSNRTSSRSYAAGPAARPAAAPANQAPQGTGGRRPAPQRSAGDVIMDRSSSFRDMKNINLNDPEVIKGLKSEYMKNSASGSDIGFKEHLDNLKSKRLSSHKDAVNLDYRRKADATAAQGGLKNNWSAMRQRVNNTNFVTRGINAWGAKSMKFLSKMASEELSCNDYTEKVAAVAKGR